jgi:sulfur relay (sulfurtransferase) DsrC/TusE family protein
VEFYVILQHKPAVKVYILKTISIFGNDKCSLGYVQVIFCYEEVENYIPV